MAENGKRWVNHRLLPLCSETVFEIRISEIRQSFQLSGFRPNPDIRQRHSVKGVILAGRINRHIAEHQALPFGERRIKAVIADDIARKAGRAAEPIDIRLFAVLVPVMYFDTSVDAMLKGIGEQVYSMKVNILDAALSVILVWALVPKLGVGGYIIMVFVTEVLNMLLSVKKLVERTHVRINVFSFFILPLICSAGAAGAAYLILPTLFSRSSQGGALFCCVGAVFTLCLYIGFLLLSGALKRADIRYFKKVLAK